MLIQRPNRRTAAPVATSWARLERWCAQNAPILLSRLRPGATKTTIRNLEAAAKVSLPDDVRESYLIHNGSEPYTGSNAYCPGILFGCPLDSIERVFKGLKFARKLHSELMKQDEEHSSGLADRATSFPEGAIKLSYTNPSWVSLSDSEPNNIGIDLDPGINGILGQVINFGRDEDNKYVLAQSWAHLLQDIADELEAGNVLLRGKSDDMRFTRRGKSDSSFFGFFRAWSIAKLPLRFQRSVPSSPTPIVEGVPIDDRDAEEARRLVKELVAALYAYDVRWFKIRPLHELGWRLVIEAGDGHRCEGFNDGRKTAPFKRLQIGKYWKKASIERKAILDKYCTVRPRAFDNAFVQRYPSEYAPEINVISEVRRIASNHLIVYMEPRNNITTRFHIRRERKVWRVDVRDITQDQIRFEARSLSG